MGNDTAGFTPSPTANWILLNSSTCAAIMLLVGIGVGWIAQALSALPLFAAFGAITIALGVAGFGIVASELLNRAQDGRWARAIDAPLEPYSQSNIRKCLNWQTAVVVIGTLQSGFGSLFFL